VEPETILALRCASALDVRLHETLEQPFRLDRGRLYGCTIADPDDEPRFTFLGDHRDIYALIGGSVGALARQFDVAVAAVTGWAAPHDGGPDGSIIPPSRDPRRYRVRVCCAITDRTGASVMRADRNPGEAVELPGLGGGELPIAMVGMWAGVRSSEEMSRRRPPRLEARHRRPA
jgi:hypothetical protein